MASPRISWDVHVPDLLQNGSLLTRWEEESSSVQALSFSVDKYGFYLAWREEDKEGNVLDLCHVSEVRRGVVPKDAKLRETLQSEGEGFLEDRSFTLVYGLNLVDTSYFHLCASSCKIAELWVEGITPLLHNLKLYNASILTQLLKLYVKLGHLASTSNMVSVKSICKCLNVGKYEQRALEGLEAMKLPFSKNDELDYAAFTFEQFYQVYLKVCARLEIEHLCIKWGGGRAPYLNVYQLVNFLNHEQRDPRLNEILYPYYNKEKALSLIWKYEKSLDNLQRDRITVNGLTRYLLSDDNLLMMPNRVEIYQDMTLPLSHYFINSSHNTYLVGRQFGGKSSVEMYRQCLLAGCRCIELDCWDGPNDEPMITHGKAMCTNIMFKDVIEAIRDSAFVTSEYPVLLSFENHCSKSQQAKMATICVDIFGDMLLTAPLESHPLEEGRALPSPSHLKGKIIIKNKKLKPEQECEEFSDYESTDISGLRRGSLKETAIIDDEIEEEEEEEVQESDNDDSSRERSVSCEEFNKIMASSEKVCNDLLREAKINATEEVPPDYEGKEVTLEDIAQYSSVSEYSTFLLSSIFSDAGLNGMTKELESTFVMSRNSKNFLEMQGIGNLADSSSLESESSRSSRTSEEVNYGHRVSGVSVGSTLSAISDGSSDSDSVTPTVTVTNSGESCYEFPSSKDENLAKPCRNNGVLESIQEVSDTSNNNDLRHVDDSDCTTINPSRKKPFYVDSETEEVDPQKVKNSSAQCNGRVDNKRTHPSVHAMNSCSSTKSSNDFCYDPRRKESTVSTQSGESNNGDDEEERDVLSDMKKREEKLSAYGSSLRLNMGGYKKNSRAASLTPEDMDVLRQFQTAGNIHPLLSSLVNYIHPVPFSGFDEAERKNLAHHISSFNESTGFGLLKASPEKFVKYNKRQFSRIYPKGSRVDSSNYMPQVFWNVGCQMVSLNFQTSDLAFQLNQGKFEYNGRCGYLLKPDLMSRSDRPFDPFTESVIDGMVAASVRVKVISGQFLSDKRISTSVEVDMYGLPTDTLRKKYKTKIVPNNGMNPVYDDDEFVFRRIVLPELALLRFGVVDDNDKLIAQRVVPLDGLQSGFRHISLRTEHNMPLPLATLFCQISLKTYVPEKYTAIVDELSEPIKYQSAADKRAAQMVVFGIDEIEEDKESNLPAFMKKQSSSPSISKMKSNSLTSINNVGVIPSPQRSRDSVVTLSYSGTRSSSELTLIESNLPKKHDGKFSPIIVEELKKDKSFVKVVKRHQKDNEALLKRYTKERTAMQREHTAQLEKLITNYEKIKITAVKTFERAAKRCGEERSEELRKVHESKMLYLNKTQTDKAKEKLSSQTEEWTNMINRQVEEEIGVFEQQAELQLETLKKVMDSAHETQIKELLARHEKENSDLTKKQTRQSIDSAKEILLDKSQSKEERDGRKKELDKQNMKQFVDETQRLKNRQEIEIEELKNQHKEEKKNVEVEFQKEQGDDESNVTGKKVSPVEEAEEANLNAAFAFLDVSSDPTSRDEEVKITLDSTVCSIEDEDQEVSFWIDEEQSRQESRIVLNEAISRITEGRVSPIASSLCSNWESTSSSQKFYYLRKVRQVFSAVLSTIAPDQEDEVFEALLRSSGYDIQEKTRDDVKENAFSNEIPILLEAYNQSESRHTRLQILSMFSRHFSKQELREMIPGLSKWQIDRARRHAAKEGPGHQVVPIPIKRTRLDPVKTSHFVNFIARPNFLQDVAYGTKELKLDSGEKITIPNVIRTMVSSRIIRQYISFCQETGFEPASERTLYRIIDVCSASKQKSIQGLDYFSTEGAQAFETLQIVVITLEKGGADSTWSREMSKTLQETKRYLKTDYKSQVGQEERCADHCTNFSLSDPQNEAFRQQCDHLHNELCNYCCKLDEVLSNITNMINCLNATLTDQQQSQVAFDLSHAVEAIHDWKAHLLRSVNQEQAKQDVLSALTDESVLIIMDWAMKYLPKRYREQMSDFYGKRGKSWHVSCVIFRSGSEGHSVETFVHVFDTCTQDWFSVVSILEHLLSTIKEEHKNVSTAYLKSDNAGCYHNGSLITSLKSIGERTGIHVRRFDFSDPQSGKDICDRKIAPLKGHIQRWVDERHDVITAGDMKEALDSHGGVRGCRVAVSEVDISKASETVEWKGISTLFNFEFLTTGIKAWKAYGVGEGQLFLYENLTQCLQGPTCLRVIIPFTTNKARAQPSLMSKTKGPVRCEDLFMCDEEGCVASFPTQSDLQVHMDTERHIMVMERESILDLARKKWAEKVTGVQLSHFAGKAGVTQESSGTVTLSRKEPLQGWALKKQRKGQRATQNVKNFLLEKFNSGVETGNKEDPVKVANEMCSLRDDSGKLRFAPEEWRTAKQISSYFSRLAAAQRQNKAVGKLLDEAEKIDENDLQTWDNEQRLRELQVSLYDQVDLRHPIIYDGHDICSLAKRGKLQAKFKVDQLKEICDTFGVVIEGPVGRKKSYITPIEALVKTCSCSK